jgi:uncharacterized protein DUF6636
MTLTPARAVRTASTMGRIGHPRRPRRLVVLGAALSVATVLGACGDRASSTPEQVGAATVTTLSAGTSVMPLESSTTEPVAPAGTTPPSTQPVAAVGTSSPSTSLPVMTSTPPLPPKPTGTHVQFTMPSGNIGCSMQSDGAVRCDIRQRDWATPARPADCNYDFGQGVVLGKTAGFVCASDTALVGAPVLPYGSTSRQGPYQCGSNESGVECINLDTGHGFSLSAANYRLF